MNEILKIPTLTFHKLPDEANAYGCKTALGFYGYRVDDDGITVFYDFGFGDQGEMVRTGNAIAAQRACNADFTSRVKEALGMDMGVAA